MTPTSDVFTWVEDNSITSGALAALLATAIALLVQKSRSALWRVAKWVSGLRIASSASIERKVDALIVMRRDLLKPAQWLLVAFPESIATATLVNLGGTAFSVQVASGYDFLQVVSLGFWEEIASSDEREFKVHWQKDYMMGWGHPEVIVRWRDGVGDAWEATVKILHAKPEKAVGSSRQRRLEDD
jgi:hypothetical protein